MNPFLRERDRELERERASDRGKEREKNAFFPCSCVQTCPEYYCAVEENTHGKQTKQNNYIDNIKALLPKVCSPNLLFSSYT